MDEKKGIAKIAKYFVNFQYGLSIVMALLLLAMKLLCVMFLNHL